MAKNPVKSPLSVVASMPLPSPSDPPGNLGQAGADLWQRVMRAYAIDDEGGKQLLFEACAACDRAHELKAAIDRDGAVVMSRTGPKTHPAIKLELEARSFVVRTLHRLGLDIEPTRPIGRPAGGHGINWGRD